MPSQHVGKRGEDRCGVVPFTTIVAKGVRRMDFDTYQNEAKKTDDIQRAGWVGLGVAALGLEGQH